mmetsp:Transcript_28060/g.64949  ORF Transcript_28060/g.64949 Transcript_28060/m.64949 type:complete len:113 (-) Transcript_28060:64-402(-)
MPSLLLDAYPNIQKHYERVKNHPDVVARYSKYSVPYDNFAFSPPIRMQQCYMPGLLEHGAGYSFYCVDLMCLKIFDPTEPRQSHHPAGYERKCEWRIQHTCKARVAIQSKPL